MPNDDLLRGAFREIRERHDGTHPDADTTLRRTLLATRKRARTRSITRFVLLPIAATLIASTVWAGTTGRLTGAIHSMLDVVRTDRPESTAPIGPTSAATPVPSTAAAAPTVAEPVAPAAQ